MNLGCPHNIAPICLVYDGGVQKAGIDNLNTKTFSHMVEHIIRINDFGASKILVPSALPAVKSSKFILTAVKGLKF